MNEEYQLAQEAIELLEKARKLIYKIEELDCGYVMGDDISQLIDALEYVGTDEGQG